MTMNWWDDVWLADSLATFQASLVTSITSIKGAYFLKSIYELIGQQSYRQAIQNYIEQFKWGNATSVDYFLL